MEQARSCPSSRVRPARRRLPLRIYPSHGLSSPDPCTVCLGCRRQRRREGFRGNFVSCIVRPPLAPALAHPGRGALPRLRGPDFVA